MIIHLSSPFQFCAMHAFEIEQISLTTLPPNLTFWLVQNSHWNCEYWYASLLFHTSTGPQKPPKINATRIYKKVSIGFHLKFGLLINNSTLFCVFELTCQVIRLRRTWYAFSMLVRLYASTQNQYAFLKNNTHLYAFFEKKCYILKKK